MFSYSKGRMYSTAIWSQSSMDNGPQRDESRQWRQFHIEELYVYASGEMYYLNSGSDMGYMTTYKIFVGKCMRKLRLKF